MDFYTKLLKRTSRLSPINLALPPSTHLRPACGSQGPQGTGVELVSSWGFISRSTRYSNRQQRAAQRDAQQYKKAGAPVDNGPRQNSKAFRLPSLPSGLSLLQHTLCHRDVLLKIPAPSGDSSTTPEWRACSHLVSAHLSSHFPGCLSFSGGSHRLPLCQGPGCFS